MKNTGFSGKWKILAAVCAGLVLLGSIPLGFLLAKKNADPLPPADPIVFTGGGYTSSVSDLPDALKTLTVTADGTDSRIIPAAGKLILTTAGPTDPETLAEYVRITPAVPMSVTQNSKTEFELTPASGTFTPGNIYRVTLGNPDNPAASYAFQVETELRVRSVLPADLALNVPVSTGVEFTFSDALTYTDFSEFITVSPKTEGSFQLYPDGRTAVFVPKENLAYDTVYTFTVRKGVKSVAGKELEEEKTVRFRTMSREYEARKAGNTAGLSFGVMTLRDNLFSPGENAVAECIFSGYRLEKTGAVKAQLYAFPSAKAAAEAMLAHEKKLGDSLENDAGYDTGALKTVKEVSAEATLGDSVILDFGNGLSRGVYLIRATVEVNGEGSAKKYTKTAWAFLQVTDIRPYTASSDGRLLVWLNAAAGGELGGASVAATAFSRTDGWNVDPATVKQLSGSTAKNGVCEFRTDDATAAIVTARNGDDACVICVSLSAEEPENYYMSYVYTDREVYFSTDTVRFWGFIRNQYTGEIPEHLYLSSRNSARKQEITLYPDGSFEGEYRLEQMRQGSVYLSLADADGNVLVSEYVRVTEDQKPVYTAQLTLDKPYYRRGDTVTATLSASFFDGTPAEGLEFLLNAKGYGSSFSERKITDKEGKIRVTLTTGQVKAYSTDPVTFSVSAELVNFETQYLYAYASGLYYHSDLIYRIGFSRNDSGVSLFLHNRDYQKTEGIFGNYWDTQDAEGTPADGEISYTLYKYVITKTEVTNYDPYYKRTVKSWKYNRSESTVTSGKANFADGKLTLPKYGVQGFTGGYYYEISYYDPTGRNTYINTVNATKDAVSDDPDASYTRVSLVLDRDAYVPGDAVRARYTVNGEAVRALFLTVGDGIHKYSVCEEFIDTFDETLLPAADIYGIAYDPVTEEYNRVSRDVCYDVGAAATLEVTVTPDKTSYKPGETAVVRVNVPGASGGKVLLSVADEACFALGEQIVNVFSFFGSGSDAYLNYLYYGEYVGGVSHKSILLNSRFNPALSATRFASVYGLESSKEEAEGNVIDAAPAEKAGESQSDTHVRKNFADNPEFRTVVLDKNGCGTLIFTVPDNITSWRITAIAAANLGAGIAKVKLGQCVSDTVCTQPFFINLSACETYIVGDTLSLSARSYGPEADGTVSYRAILTNEKGEKLAETTAKADAKDRAWLKFDAQPEGLYTVTVYGTCGSAEDALETRLQVIASAVTADVRRTVPIDEIRSIGARYYPVSLTFFNPTETGPLYDAVEARLRRGNGSNRADMLTAKYVAILASEALYGTVSSEDLSAIAEQLRDYGGTLVSLLPYSEGDMELTVRILALCPEILTENRRADLRQYFETLLSGREQTDDVSLCAEAAALAALGEPVLDRLYAIASVGNGFCAKAKLYLSLGFACAGDFGAANDIYGQLRAAMGVEDTEYGTLYLKADNPQTTAELTSLALCAAARIAREDASKLASYLNGNTSRETSDELALATYLRFFLPTGPLTEKTFAYTVGDVHEEITLKSGHGYTVSLTKAELQALTVDSADEGITVRAAYRGSPAEMSDEEDMNQRVHVAKEIAPYKDGMYRVTLTVFGTSTRVSEQFDLNDTIPAGARLVALETNASSYGKENGVYRSAYLWNRTGQTLTGSVSLFNERYWNPKERTTVCPEYSFEISVSYIIRGAVEGTFSAEPAFIRSYAAGIFSISESYRVAIFEKSAWKIERKQ